MAAKKRKYTTYAPEAVALAKRMLLEADTEIGYAPGEIEKITEATGIDRSNIDAIAKGYSRTDIAPEGHSARPEGLAPMLPSIALLKQLISDHDPQHLQFKHTGRRATVKGLFGAPRQVLIGGLFSVDEDDARYALQHGTWPDDIADRPERHVRHSDIDIAWAALEREMNVQRLHGPITFAQQPNNTPLNEEA